MEYKNADQTTPTRYLRLPYHVFNTRLMFDSRSWRPNPRTHVSIAGVHFAITGSGSIAVRSGPDLPAVQSNTKWGLRTRNEFCEHYEHGTYKQHNLQEDSQYSMIQQHGVACRGLSWPVVACRGLSWPGLAWPGLAWRVHVVYCMSWDTRDDIRQITQGTWRTMYDARCVMHQM